MIITQLESVILMQGLKYLFGGLVLITIAIALLLYVPNALQFTVQLVIGGVVSGLVLFGLIFLFVAMEEMKSHIAELSATKETPKKKK